MALPGWGDLEASNERTARHRQASALLDAVPSTRFVVFLLAIAAIFTLYVGHVHASQDVLADLQELRHDNLHLHLKYNQLKGDFDRLTGPAAVYEKARAMGFVEGYEYGPTIQVEE